MVDATIVPLSGKGIFSPSGKLLVVCGQKELSIYDTRNGKKFGNLENSSSAHPNQQDSLIFSPQETYIALKNRIWKTADCQQHVPTILETGHVKAWNKYETKLFTEIPDKKLWFLIDSSTGLPLHTFDYSHEFAPLQFSTSDDGTLVSFTFPVERALYLPGEPRTKTLIFSVGNQHKSLEIDDGHRTAFFPNNIHALVSNTKGDVTVVNALLRIMIRTFVCGNSLTPCNITINNMKSIITHPFLKSSFCTINYEGHGFCFSFQRHQKPAVDQKLLSNTEKLRVEKVQPGSRLYLHYRTDASKEPQLLLDSVNAQEDDVIFAGDHDEHILVLSGSIIHLLRPTVPDYRRKIPYGDIAISPNKHSFVITTPERKHILYILSHAIDILSKEKNSYFSLLPDDIKMFFKDYKT